MMARLHISIAFGLTQRGDCDDQLANRKRVDVIYIIDHVQLFL